MEPACSKAQKEEEKDEGALSGDVVDEARQQETAEEEETPAAATEEKEEAEEEEVEEEEEKEEEDVADDMCAATPVSLNLVSQIAPSEPEQNLQSYRDLPPVADLNPDAKPNPNSNFDLNPSPNPISHFAPSPSPNPNPNPASSDPIFHSPNPSFSPCPTSSIDDEDILNDQRPEICTQPQKIDKLVTFSVATDDNSMIVSASELNISVISPSELHSIPEIGPEEETCKEDTIMAQQESEKENLGEASRVQAGAQQSNFSSRLPRFIKNFPPLLPITQQQSMAPPALKANKKEQVCRKLPVNEGTKPVNEGIKPVSKMSKSSEGSKPIIKINKASEGSATPKQRQPGLPVNHRSTVKRRVSNESNEHNLPSPSWRENEDEPSHNCSRASIESSPCLRQQGCISLDDLRRFSTLHTTSRSNSRLERFSLRGGKIDRVARFAQLQKIWKKDSFVRGIDGEKRPQILQHLFTPTRTT